MEYRKTIQKILLEDENIIEIPPEHWKAFQKAINWKPKTRIWGETPEQAAQRVQAGLKPLIGGFEDEIINQLADRHNLATRKVGNKFLLTMQNNEDLIDAFEWVISAPIEDHHKNYLWGVLYGYPTTDILDYCKLDVPPDIIQASVGSSDT
jgi:hypothetical protein